MGLFDKGVQKTRRSFFEKITRVVAGHSRVSDGLLDNIEEALVASDMGVDTTLRIIDRLEDRVAADRYLTTEELLGMLHEEIASLLNTNLRSVETARYRLRKKLGLEGGANLTSFLQAVNLDADVDDDANADADKQ